MVPTFPESSKAATARPAAHTGPVPEVHEAPAHRGAVQENPQRSGAVWSTGGSGRATAQQAGGEEREQGKLGKYIDHKPQIIMG